MFELVAMLGISTYTAQKIIDILLAASSVWAVIGIIAAIIGTGGWSVVLLITARALAQRYGRAYAVAW